MGFSVGKDIIAASCDFSNISTREVSFLPGFYEPVQNWFHPVSYYTGDDLVEGRKKGDGSQIADVPWVLLAFGDKCNDPYFLPVWETL